MPLVAEHCGACTRDTPLLAVEEVETLLAELGQEWRVADTGHLERHVACRGFGEPLGLTAEIALLAEREQHHPELHLGHGHLDIEIWSHAPGGLTRNDFVLAARVEAVIARR
jgi:4a-hydroxytetrahydrobiopterin dehydratase